MYTVYNSIQIHICTCIHMYAPTFADVTLNAYTLF